MIKTFGVIGHQGMVGNALYSWLKQKDRTIFGYDLRDEGDGKQIVAQAECIFVCTPTPFRDGKCDTSSIEQSLKWISELMSDSHDTIVVIKSTVPPGTTKRLQEQYPQLLLMFNPEFLTEATADADMAYPDRQIMGVSDVSMPRAREVIMNLPLAPYTAIIGYTEAEAIKYMGNTYFVMKNIFANTWYDYCAVAGIDYEVVKEGVAADKRIERTHLNILHKGGRGASGSCLPKDLAASIHFMDEAGTHPELFEHLKELNDELCFSTGKIETKGMYNFEEEVKKNIDG